MDVLCPQFSLIQNYKLLSYSCNLVFVSLTIDFFQNFSQFLVWMLENSEEQWTAINGKYTGQYGVVRMRRHMLVKPRLTAISGSFWQAFPLNKFCWCQKGWTWLLIQIVYVIHLLNQLCCVTWIVHGYNCGKATLNLFAKWEICWFTNQPRLMHLARYKLRQ